MKVLITAYYEFLKHIRDIKMIAILALFPICTILILGTAVEGFFSTDSSKTISVGYVNNDAGATGKEFDNFLEVKEIKDRLEVIKYNDKDQGQKALDSGIINSLIYIPKDLSQNMLKGNKQSILLYGSKDVEFVENLISGFTSSFNAVNVTISFAGKPVQLSRQSGIKRIFYADNATAPRVIDYYSVLVLLQTIILGAIFGVYITTKTYGSDIHIRTHSLPMNRITLISGRILGSTLYLFLASTITVVFSKVAYHVNWNGNLIIIFGTLLVFCSITVGIGVLIGLLVPSFSSALIIVLLLMMSFGVISGAISPVSINNSLSIFTPNYHAKLLIFGTIYGYSKQVMLEAALWLLGFMVIFYGTATVLLRRAKYDNI